MADARRGERGGTLMAATTFRFIVQGIAQPKGSTRAVATGVVVPDNPKGKPWQDAIGWEAKRALRGYCYAGPIAVWAAFHLPRPRRLRKPFMGRPDIDKLLRCVLDALTGIAYGDDGQVSEIHAYKAYAVGTPHTCITLSDAIEGGDPCRS